MSGSVFTESEVEEAALEWLEGLGWAILHGPDIAPGGPDAKRADDWLAVNQFTVVEGEHKRRPDIVLLVNGLPLGLIELKNPADEKATVWTAWQQIQTYKAELSDLFAFNAALIASDGVDARVGTLTAGREWFKPWRTIDGETLRATRLQREGFELHETSGGYESGRQPGGEPGDRRIGVVWHTQELGSPAPGLAARGRRRRAEPAHHVRRQADARPRPDAGDRAGEPGLPG